MFKRELGVARLVDLDHEHHSALGAAKGEGLAGVLVGDGVQVLEVVIGTALDHAATKLGLLIRVVEIDEGECDPRIASSVLRFEGAFPGTDQDAVPFPADPRFAFETWASVDRLTALANLPRL
jgi:hypothetical protein